MSNKPSQMGKPEEKEQVLERMDPNRRGVGKQGDAIPPGGSAKENAERASKDHDPAEITRRKVG